MQELDRYIDQVKSLPPAPVVLPKLLGALHEPDVDASKVVDLITYDPSLTARMLQLCNSATFGIGEKITSVHEAVTRLGFREVYQLVAAATCARSLSRSQKGYGIDEGELWKHSVTAALAAQLIASETGDDETTTFTGGLLHDLGKLVLADALKDKYEEVLREVRENHRSLLQTEKALLGVQHAEIGGRLLQRWQFPEAMVAAVWNHHSPHEAGDFQRDAALLYLGNLIAYFVGHGYGHQAFAFQGRKEALEILELKPEHLPQFMIRTCEQFETVEKYLFLGK